MNDDKDEQKKAKEDAATMMSVGVWIITVVQGVLLAIKFGTVGGALTSDYKISWFWTLTPCWGMAIVVLAAIPATITYHWFLREDGKPKCDKEL